MIDWFRAYAFSFEEALADGRLVPGLRVAMPENVLYHELLHAARFGVGVALGSTGKVHAAASCLAATWALAKVALRYDDLAVSKDPDQRLEEWAVSATPELYQLDERGEREAQQVVRLSDLRDLAAEADPASSEVAAWDQSSYLAPLLVGNTFEGDAAQMRLGYDDQPPVGARCSTMMPPRPQPVSAPSCARTCATTETLPTCIRSPRLTTRRGPTPPSSRGTIGVSPARPGPTSGRPFPSTRWCTFVRQPPRERPIVPFLDYDIEIRRMTCSTNAIESLDARCPAGGPRTRTFPAEQAAMECLYLVTRSLQPGRGRPRPVDDALQNQ